MKNVLPVYEGKLPYIFISYSHKDTARVETLIRGLQERGYRVWFDKGIHGGVEWPDYIAKHLRSCGVFLPVFSRNFLESPNCMREVHYALKTGRKILPVYLETVDLPEALDMQLSHIQALWCSNDWISQGFWSAIDKADVLECCRGDSPILPSPASEKRFSRISLWIGIAAAAAILLGVLLVGGLANKPGPVPEDTAPEAVMMEETEPAATDLTEPKEVPYGNMLQKGPPGYVNSHTSLAFGTDITHEAIQSITFLNTVEWVPKNAMDASLLQNGAVRVWAVKSGYHETLRNGEWLDLYDLYIASEGGVYAPPDASHLFSGMRNLEIIEFNNAFYTDYVQNFSYMFHNCEKLTRLDVSAFNTEYAEDMSAMFEDCASLEVLDVSSFDMSSVYCVERMFYGCGNLKSLNISGWDLSGVGKYADFLDEGVLFNDQPWENLFISQ